MVNEKKQCWGEKRNNHNTAAYQNFPKNDLREIFLTFLNAQCENAVYLVRTIVWMQRKVVR